MPRLSLQIVAIITLVLGVYCLAPSAGFIPIDDASLTYKNPLVTTITPQTITGVFSTYDPELYVPLTLISYQLDYAIGGENPAVFHSTNVLLHLMNSILVLLLVRLLTKRSWVPVLTAVIFAVHPLNTEAVLWVSGRKDLLSAMFFLSSLILYCKYATANKRLPYYSSIILFALALMSKVVTATLPLVLIIIDDVLKVKNTKQQRLQKCPYALLAMLFLYVGMLGKSLSMYFVSYFETFLLAGKSAAFYVQKIVLPTGLMPLYQQDLPINPLSTEFILPFAILALLYVIAIASRPIHRLISFGILWYGVTLLPNLANFARGEGWSIFYASDRYAYLPSIGFILSLVIGISLLHEAASKTQKRWLTSIVACCIVALSYGAHYQSKLWLSAETLFTYNIKQNPKVHLAHALLGILDLEIDNFEEAIAHLRASSKLAPTFPDGRSHLGLALIKNGQIDEGITELEVVIAQTADYSPAYVYLAYGQLLKKDYVATEQTINHVLQIEPTNAKAYQLLGAMAEELGDAIKAEEYYRHSLELNPRSVRTMSALRRVL